MAPVEVQRNHVPVTITPIQQMVSSCSGAIMTSLFVTPLDVVKIRLQAQAKPSNFTKGHCFLYCNGLMDHLCSCIGGVSKSSEWYKRPVGKFNGSLDAAIQIARSEGITSLWSGLPPTLLMAVPATVIYFTMYEQLKVALKFQMHDTSFINQVKPLTAGAIARTWAVTVISPIEMIRVKVQSEQYSYSQVWVAVKEMIKANGFFSLWRGLGPTLLRDVPFSAMYWLGYETLKSKFLLARGESSIQKPSDSLYIFFASGAISGAFAGLCTLPFDVIKTRRQIELGELALLGNKRAPSSTWKIIYKIYTQEGVSKLFSGLLPRLLKVAPSCAIMISSYEFFKHFFFNRNQNQTTKPKDSS